MQQAGGTEATMDAIATSNDPDTRRALLESIQKSIAYTQSVDKCNLHIAKATLTQNYDSRMGISNAVIVIPTLSMILSASIVYICPPLGVPLVTLQKVINLSAFAGVAASITGVASARLAEATYSRAIKGMEIDEIESSRN